jgi:cysteinyl-tRNA synthetase
MKLYNTLSRSVEELKPINPPVVTFYSCGPTVYDFTHIGHMRTYINNDVLKRALTFSGYKVNHVMNVTDVGHLTGDSDEGDDKLEKGAKKSGKTVWEVAEFYTENFLQTMKALDVLPANHLTKATDHIQDMIDLIKILEEKGFTYRTEEAIYFDVTKFPNYGNLSGQKLEDKKTGAREDVKVDAAKHNAADFALWFFTVGRFADHSMHWASPWGDGFPGWHIECSAMSMKYLGPTIDIHSGGIDHVPVHHENEIAQSEAATGKPFVNIWFHNAFLLVDGVKMSKSLGNFYTLKDIEKKGIHPAAIRYLFLQTHYRQEMNFTWDSAQAAATAFLKLQEQVRALRVQTQRTVLSTDKLGQVDDFRAQFSEALQNDLQMPKALGVVWSMLKSNIPSEDKLDLLLAFDQVLGLDLANVKLHDVSEEITELAKQREEARNNKDFAESDRLRKQIEDAGFVVEDTPEGYTIKRK